MPGLLTLLDPKREPISVSTVATVISWIAAKYALNLDTQTVTAIATIVFVLGQYAARQWSVPIAKHVEAVRDVKDAAAAGIATSVKP